MNIKQNIKLLTLAAGSRGALYEEKIQIINKYFPSASLPFRRCMQSIFDCILLLKVNGKTSGFRINENLNFKSGSVYLRIFKQFNLIDEHQDEQTKVKYYTLTPLSAKMIDDLLMLYDEKINTYLKLNAKDKRTKPAKLLANSKNKAKK